MIKENLIVITIITCLLSIIVFISPLTKTSPLIAKGKVIYKIYDDKPFIIVQYKNANYLINVTDQKYKKIKLNKIVILLIVKNAPVIIKDEI